MKKVGMWMFGIVVGIVSLPLCIIAWPVTLGWYMSNEED